MGDLHLPSSPPRSCLPRSWLSAKQGLSRITLILRGRFLVQPRLCNIFSFDLWVWVKYWNSEKEIGYERVCFVCATTAVAALL